MKVISTNNFDRDIHKVRDKKLASAIKKIIQEMSDAESIIQLKN